MCLVVREVDDNEFCDNKRSGVWPVLESMDDSENSGTLPESVSVGVSRGASGASRRRKDGLPMWSRLRGGQKIGFDFTKRGDFKFSRECRSIS